MDETRPLAHPIQFNRPPDLTQPAAARQPTPCAAPSLLPKRTQQHHLPLPSQFYLHPRFLTPLPHALPSCTSVLVLAVKGKASFSGCKTFSFFTGLGRLSWNGAGTLKRFVHPPPPTRTCTRSSDPRPSNASLAEPPTGRIPRRQIGHALQRIAQRHQSISQVIRSPPLCPHADEHRL